MWQCKYKHVLYIPIVQATYDLHTSSSHSLSVLQFTFIMRQILGLNVLLVILLSTTTRAAPTTAVPDECATLNCASDEQCMMMNGVWGCACSSSNQRPNPDFFGVMETCMGSTVTVSLSRCQLFEAGYSASMVHLLDEQCTGTLVGNQVVFTFDGHHCGGFVKMNSTHFIYKNTIMTSNTAVGVIGRSDGLNLNISCAYPLIQNVSMSRPIYATGGLISGEISAAGTYNVTMVPYTDSSFSFPKLGNLTQIVNYQIYIAVSVEGFQPEDVATVLDSCWATPVPEPDYYIRWNLIINDCPNPEDGTVQVLQNGVSTSSHFSFRMFTFTSSPTPNIYLHCQVHLCQPQSGRCEQPCNDVPDRRRRSAEDVHDVAAISMGLYF